MLICYCQRKMLVTFREVVGFPSSTRPSTVLIAISNSTPDAHRDMLEAPQGLHAFLRAYFHMKSADWSLNIPEPLALNLHRR